MLERLSINKIDHKQLSHLSLNVRSIRNATLAITHHTQSQSTIDSFENTTKAPVTRITFKRPPWLPAYRHPVAPAPSRSGDDNADPQTFLPAL